MRTRAERVAFGGVFTALAAILSYVEALLPINLGVPGIKPGFANIVTVFILYRAGFLPALAVSLIRVILVSAMFASPAAALYSLAGAVVSLSVMTLMKKCGCFSVIGVSMAGGVFHNVSQLAIAAAVTKTPLLVTYLPVLIIAGMITGIIIGFISKLVIIRLFSFPNQNRLSRKK